MPAIFYLSLPPVETATATSRLSQPETSHAAEPHPFDDIIDRVTVRHRLAAGRRRRAPSAAASRDAARLAGRRFGEGRLSWLRAVTRGTGVRLRSRVGACVRPSIGGGAASAVLALAPSASAAFKPLFTATSSGDA